MPVFAIVFIAVVVINLLAREAISRIADAKLELLFDLGRFDDCIEYLDRRILRIVYPTFKQYMLRFSIYDAQGEEFGASRMLDHLLGMRLSAKKRLNLVNRAFNFYVNKNKKKAARTMLEEIKEAGGALAADAELTYNSVFEKDASQIKKLEQLLNHADIAQKAKLYFLLQYQHKNAGHKKEAKYYQDLLSSLQQSAEDNGDLPQSQEKENEHIDKDLKKEEASQKKNS